jgi:hypothetical protein
MVGVCIVKQAARDGGSIDPAVLERLGGFKVKISVRSTADVLISHSGNTVAFDILESRDFASHPSAIKER